MRTGRTAGTTGPAAAGTGPSTTPPAAAPARHTPQTGCQSEWQTPAGTIGNGARPAQNLSDGYTSPITPRFSRQLLTYEWADIGLRFSYYSIVISVDLSFSCHKFLQISYMQHLILASTEYHHRA